MGKLLIIALCIAVPMALVQAHLPHCRPQGMRTAKLAEKLPLLKNHRYAVQIGGAMGFIVIFGIIVWITKIPAVIYFAVSGAVVGLINGMATTLMYNDN